MAPQRTPLPVALETVPEVSRALDGRGLGVLLPETIHSFNGRNDNWSGRTSTGAQIFLKKIEGPHAQQRFDRTLRFERLRRQGRAPVPAPRCLGWDESSRIMIYELLDGARSASDLADDEAFTQELADEAGTVVGRLHNMLVEVREVHGMRPVRILLDGQEAVSAAAYASASGALLELWGLFQGDATLAAAVDRLQRSTDQAPRAPIHGDLRLDQFLCSANGLSMVDWEEFCYADPARDIGAFMGEWIHRALSAGLTESPTDNETLMKSWGQELDRRMPFIRAFWDGYVEERVVTDPELGVRTAGFTGWHLLDRVMAGCIERHKLTALQRAQIGIARTIMIDSKNFLEITGIEADTASKELVA
ncbi:class V lanthionine synthetase subunit LxmK [Streptomyces sp. NPDC048309]|uniref:class V lanthionine synthetase subunit LxmK n=1 Tax=Streptomyces sp. NPDC048309 TaxID=3154618 RepID=UPI0033C186B8